MDDAKHYWVEEDTDRRRCRWRCSGVGRSWPRCAPPGPGVCWTWAVAAGRSWPTSCVTRQPREQAAAEAARPQRAGHPRAGRDARAAGGRGRGVPQAPGAVPRQARQPPRARRRPPRRRPRRAQAGLPEPVVAPRGEFALYGETTGETDEYGLPVRYPWAEEYRGDATVLYGHTPVPRPEWVNNTMCLDTGVVFGGRLTAMRWPERELAALAAVPAAHDGALPQQQPPRHAGAPGAGAGRLPGRGRGARGLRGEAHRLAREPD